MSKYTVNTRRYRDLTIIDMDQDSSLVVACDSAGAIGPKLADVVKVSGYILGRFTSRVALMEVLACGAEPVCVVNTLCVEPHPGGAEINLGIADEIRECGLDPDRLMTGSSEKNIPTAQSGLGVTVIGVVKRAELKLGQLQAGDCLALIGLPKVGPEVFLGDPDIVDLPLVTALREDPNIKELVPVGSRGVLAEAAGLALINGLELITPSTRLDLKKSAGPCTCLMAAGNKAALTTACNKFGRPWTMIGSFAQKG